MPGTSRLSPLTLPWSALTLAGRFAVPLALWYTLGELLRFVLMYAGYRLALVKALASVAPIAILSLMVMTTVCITVAMVHSVRDGLDAVRAREEDGELAPWAVGNDESILDALTRTLLPFMVFYLAWGWFSEDAREFVSNATERGFLRGGIEGQLQGQAMLISLEKHLPIAVALTAGFLAARIIAGRLLRDRAPGIAGVLVAYLEVNWTLFGVFTIDDLRRKLFGWLADRQAWDWVKSAIGPDVLALWPLFAYAVLGSLVWLVIAGVILGLDAGDEQIVLGTSRVARRVVQVSGLDRERSAREVVTGELRDRWLPTWYGLRLARRAGIVPFAVLAALLMGLDTGEVAARREIYELLGAHEIAWWIPRLHVIGFATGLVQEMLRICLLAAAFNLVVGRVMARTAAKPARPRTEPTETAAPPAPVS